MHKIFKMHSTDINKACNHFSHTNDNTFTVNVNDTYTEMT